MSTSATVETICGHCGQVRGPTCLDACARDGLDPPRYCTACGRRMVVQVDPFSWRARCSRHGERTPTDRR
ncbi:biotin synthase auxiliary protein BsaP [Pseudonocardia petroleophila]|uniref:biotin synthase auxiliary protein BsaP n=1 Tax=Pseudonocardia petroleophila TaxID=37331 RepID=UPI002103FFA1|nr:hypothetical protein [Pseudonocardia petroleophila]